MPNPSIIAVSGGIGSGKSVVCRIISTLGFSVYDCDSNAKRLMDNSEELKYRLTAEICNNCVDTSGHIDRMKLADIVFNDASALSRLNSIVHSSVRDDIKIWSSNQTGHLVFIESAIVYQSGLDKIVDAIWEVCAPEETRIRRIVDRNGWDTEHIRQRINSQLNYAVVSPHPSTYAIINDGLTPVLPQILHLLEQFKSVNISPRRES